MLVTALPIGAVVACTAGDPVAYQAAPLMIVEGGILDEAGRVTIDSGISPTPVVRADGGLVTPPNPVSCTSTVLTTDGDGGCDSTAGMGCCLPASNSTGTITSNQCDQQVQFTLGTFCHAPSDVFVACLGSNGDSTCCWQQSGGGFHARFAADCSGGFEACDPSSPGGGTCNGQPGGCQAVPCRGVTIGYCLGSATGAPPSCP